MFFSSFYHTHDKQDKQIFYIIFVPRIHKVTVSVSMFFLSNAGVWIITI